MARFSIPAQAAKSRLVIDTMLGIDYTSNATNVSKSQSPDAPNMIRDEPGKVRKRMGYLSIANYPARINGCYALNKTALIHAGNALYKLPDTETPLYANLADARSNAWQLEDKLYIADGKCLLVYDGDTVQPVQNVAKIPTLTIAKKPEGGGEQYEALNLLQPKFKELFAGDGSSTKYHLSFSGLDSADVTVRKLNSDGSWQTVTNYTCDAEKGIVTFATAPEKSPVTGEDNIEITAARTVKGYADRINKCRFGILFGVNGAADRLFLTGNPDYKNLDWYSGQYDATYFPDTGYSKLGTAKSAVMGYNIVENRLAAHKDAQETDRNVIVRSGNLVDNEPAFPIANTIQGPGVIAPYSFAYLDNEPVFLTSLGIFAITPSDVVGERLSQNRSYYMNGRLNGEAQRDEAFACVYRDMYWLCLNGVAYVLDGQQNLGANKNEPYSNRQYACFYETNIPARVMWTDETDLYFGSDTGAVYRFYRDPENIESYQDDGEPIYARWETPDLYGNLFYKNKRFKYLALQLKPSAVTSVTVYAMKRGLWGRIWQNFTKARYFSYGQIVYSKFTYSNDETPRTLHNKISIKRVDKARFRVENGEALEPFGLMQIAVEFVENGNFKG